MRKNFYEIFEEVENSPDTLSKIAVLRQNANPALLLYLKNVFNPGVRFCVESVPEYKPQDMPVGMGFTSIDMELKRSYLFQPGHPSRPANLSQKRMNEILIQILESLENKDAAIFADMFRKKTPYPSITRALAESAFPNQI